jgi:glycosyltransferase involved in cell wall biosynthesis
MTILHIIFSFTIGGAETMLVDIMNEQSKTQRVQLLIINDTVNKHLIANINKEIVIHYLKRKPGSRNPFPIMKFNFWVFKINPEVIHFHNDTGINLLRIKTKAVTCLTIHDVNISLLNFYKYKKLFSISNAVQEDVLTRGKMKSVLVYNGIKFEDIEFNSCLDKVDKFKIVQISRLDYQKKGQHILLKAICILVKQKAMTNIQLDLIGEGESLEYLKILAKQLNIEKHINFLGMKSRKFIYTELKNYQLLVQPSLYEGFGLTVVEGIAAKIPVLVSDIEGPMEIIDKGRYGWFFKKGDVKECAEKLSEIINDYHTVKNSNRINEAYNYAKVNFNIINTAQNYLNNYTLEI